MLNDDSQKADRDCPLGLRSSRGENRTTERAVRHRPASAAIFRRRHCFFWERHALKCAIASAGALCRFFSSLEDQLKQAEHRRSKPTVIFRFSRSFSLKSHQTYFSTRMNSPVEALTATVSLAFSR